MQFLVERFVPLSSQFKIILVSTGKKLSSLKEQDFFSNLASGIIDHLIQKIVFISYLVTSRKLKFQLLVAFVRLTKVLSFCKEPLSLQHSLP